jgi:hypothetical protein
MTDLPVVTPIVETSPASAPPETIPAAPPVTATKTITVGLRGGSTKAYTDPSLDWQENVTGSLAITWLDSEREVTFAATCWDWVDVQVHLTTEAPPTA